MIDYKAEAEKIALAKESTLLIRIVSLTTVVIGNADCAIPSEEQQPNAKD